MEGAYILRPFTMRSWNCMLGTRSIAPLRLRDELHNANIRKCF